VTANLRWFAGWSNRWKEALNAFEMTLVGRLAAGRKQQSDNDLHIIWTVPDSSVPSAVTARLEWLILGRCRAQR
jgi:hypothetical protein